SALDAPVTSWLVKLVIWHAVSRRSTRVSALQPTAVNAHCVGDARTVSTGQEAGLPESCGHARDGASERQRGCFPEPILPLTSPKTASVALRFLIIYF